LRYADAAAYALAAMSKMAEMPDATSDMILMSIAKMSADDYAAIASAIRYADMRAIRREARYADAQRDDDAER